MRMHVRARWIAAFGLVGALGVGALGGFIGSAGAAAGSPKVHKHALSAPVTTATFTFSASLSGLTPAAVTVTGNGQADFTNKAVSLTVNVPAVVAALIPGGTAAPEVVHVVLAGGTVYLEIPSLAPLVGAPWISVALPSAATSAGTGISAKVASALANVTAIVQFAQTHHAGVTSLGTATVDGVQATGSHIVATLPHQKAGQTLSANLWADSSDRLVQGSVTVAGAGSLGTIGLAATIDLSGYGAPVTVTVPPSAQVRAIPYATVAALVGKFLHLAGRI